MLKFKLTQNKVVLLAFSIPFILRLIPEFLAGYYPIGWDSPKYASIALLRDPGGLSFSGGPLFQVLLISLRTLTTADVFILIKIISAALYGLLGLAVYYFARNYLGWEVKKSFVVVLFIAFYFVTLRISWDLFRNELGLIFLFITLPWLKRLHSIRNGLTMAVLSFLIVLSHPLVAAVFFFIVGGYSLLNLIRGRNGALKPILFALPAGVLFSVSVIPGLLPSLTTGLRSGFLGPTVEGIGGNGLLFNYLSPNPWNPSGGYSSLFGYVWILFFFSYGLILFFVCKGVWREHVLGLWTLCLLICSFSCLVTPSAAIPYADRWMFMLIFPFSFYAVNGLEKLRDKSFSVRILRKKITATTIILALLVCLAGFYVTTPAFVFGIGPTYRSIPGKMLRTNIELDDVPSYVETLQWLNHQVDNDSCVVLDRLLLDWALIYLDENVNIYYSANTHNMFDLASQRGFKIYFLWYRGLETFDNYELNEIYTSKGNAAVYSLLDQ